jgi:hypothetical protein
MSRPWFACPTGSLSCEFGVSNVGARLLRQETHCRISMLPIFETLRDFAQKLSFYTSKLPAQATHAAG